jgi:hypothetical protein
MASKFQELREKNLRARNTQSSPNYGPGGQGSGGGFSGSMSAQTDLNNEVSSNNNSGIDAFNFNNAPGGSGSYDATTAAQTMLGNDYYNKAMKFMSPQELNDQIAKAQSYGRGIDLTQFKNNLDKFEGFQNANGEPFNFEGTQYLSVNDPMITANAPTLAQLMGDIGGGIGDMMGAGADFIMGGGTMGKVLGGLKEKFAQGKDFVGDMINPGNINERVNALSPEQRRIYTMYMSQGMPYQQAFEQASGQAFARGGISSLN